MTSIFERQRLTPSQARTVSNRRYEDAKALRDTGRNAHANGAMYLAGIALELLPKARLLEEHPWLKNRRQDSARLTRTQRELFDLCYVRHDLGGLLERLPELRDRLANAQVGSRNAMPLLTVTKQLCSEWTIHVRYSTRQADISEARLFLGRVRELIDYV